MSFAFSRINPTRVAAAVHTYTLCVCVYSAHIRVTKVRQTRAHTILYSLTLDCFDFGNSALTFILFFFFMWCALYILAEAAVDSVQTRKSVRPCYTSDGTCVLCVVYTVNVTRYKRLLGVYIISRYARRPTEERPQQTTATTTGRETSSHARVDVHEKWFSCAHRQL